jgi:glycine cleavage system H lipoate-binding protein
MAARPATTVERTYVSYYFPDVHGASGHDQVVLKHPNGLCVVCLSPEHPMCAPSLASSGGRAGDAVFAETTGKRKRDEGSSDADTRGNEELAADMHVPDAGTRDDIIVAPVDWKNGVVGAVSSGVEEGGEDENRRTTEKTGWRSYDVLSRVDFACGKGNASHVNITGKKKKGAKVMMENSGIVLLVDAKGNEWTARACVRGKLLEQNEKLLRECASVTTDPLGAGFLVILEPRPEDIERLKRRAMNAEQYAVFVAERRKKQAIASRAGGSESAQRSVD